MRCGQAIHNAHHTECDGYFPDVSASGPRCQPLCQRPAPTGGDQFVFDSRITRPDKVGEVVAVVGGVTEGSMGSMK